MADKAVVLDANILVRAVLGRRNRDLIERHAEEVSFFVPEIVLCEAKDNLPKLVVNRGGDPEKALAVLDALARLVELNGTDVYGSFEEIARERIGARDPDDWPVLAAALALDCPIWTEDTDFFGCGVATWTSLLVEKYLAK